MMRWCVEGHSVTESVWSDSEECSGHPKITYFMHLFEVVDSRHQTPCTMQVNIKI
jgi:hypothetical protein